MKPLLAIPAFVMSLLIAFLHSRAYDVNPARDLIAGMTLFLPLLTIPCSVIGGNLVCRTFPERPAAGSVLAIIHTAGLAAAGYCVWMWLQFFGMGPINPG
jgi:hypothetical protein